jgi:hypothetical protein
MNLPNNLACCSIALATKLSLSRRLSRVIKARFMTPKHASKLSVKADSSPRTVSYSLIAVLGGLVVLFAIYPIFQKEMKWNDIFFDIFRELAMVLISVFGVSYLYEKLSAREHFSKFTEILQDFVERGESVTAKCESLGIREIHNSRESFQRSHPFSEVVSHLHSGDKIRVTGRSLNNTMRDAGQFIDFLRAGGSLEFCMCDPEHSFETLSAVSHYFANETKAAIEQFQTGIVRWLEKDGAEIRGNVELRLHRIDLMDTIIEFKAQDRHMATLDLNFGVNKEQRYVFYVDAKKTLGRDLCERSQAIWSIATTNYKFEGSDTRKDRH